MTPRTSRHALWLLIPLAGACHRPDPAPYEDVRPVRSATAQATRGGVGATYSGVVRARHESRLGFLANGRVVARLVDVGAPVRRGQPLMRLDPIQQTLQVTAASADVDGAGSRVAQLKVELQRTEALRARDFASQAEVDQQRLALSEAEAQLKSALARQQIQLNQRGWTELVADRDGVVTAVSADVGQVVSPGQPVVTLAVDGEREIEISIPESRVAELRDARALQVSLWSRPDRRYAGSLRELAPSTDSVTRTYAARISVKDADAAVMLGMTASVFAPDVSGDAAIRLPLTAIHDRDGRPRVWVIDPATSAVAPRAVELGAIRNDVVLVKAGLADGEQVVTAGVHRLHDGQRVQVTAPPPLAPSPPPTAGPTRADGAPEAGAARAAVASRIAGARP